MASALLNIVDPVSGKSYEWQKHKKIEHSPSPAGFREHVGTPDHRNKYEYNENYKVGFTAHIQLFWYKKSVLFLRDYIKFWLYIININ